VEIERPKTDVITDYVHPALSRIPDHESKRALEACHASSPPLSPRGKNESAVGLRTVLTGVHAQETCEFAPIVDPSIRHEHQSRTLRAQQRLMLVDRLGRVLLEDAAEPGFISRPDVTSPIPPAAQGVLHLKKGGWRDRASCLVKDGKNATHDEAVRLETLETGPSTLD
jgi:hypothetical protein